VLAAPVKLADGTVAKYIGVQVDVTRKTEGTCSAFADGTRPAAGGIDGAAAGARMPRADALMPRSCIATAGSGVPLLVKYDSRLKSSNAGMMGEVMQARSRAAFVRPRCTCLTTAVCVAGVQRRRGLDQLNRATALARRLGSCHHAGAHPAELRGVRPKPAGLPHRLCVRRLHRVHRVR
jgi:hypothetical protein